MLKRLVSIFLYMLLISNFSSVSASENYLATVYDNLNGLQTSEANCVVQTQDGYIWVASYGSLSRFDGKQFIQFEEPKGLTSVLTLFEDVNGKLWIGTNNSGVVCYYNHEFTFIETPSEVNSFSARTITGDENGNVIVGTSSGMFQINQDFETKVISNEQLKDAYITSLHGYGQQKTVGITKKGDFFILNGTEIEKIISIDDWEYDIPLCAKTIQKNGKEVLLVGLASNYMLEIDGDIITKIPTENLWYTNAITQAKDGKIWIGSDSGIAYMDQDYNLEIIEDLPIDSSIDEIMIDFEDNIWATSSRQGLLKITPNIFKNITSKIETEIEVNAVAVVGDDIYFSSDKGLKIVNKQTLEPVHNKLTDTYGHLYIRCITKDDKGNLYLSSYSDMGLIKYNVESEEITLINHEKGLDYTRIRSSICAENGDVWVATGNGVYHVSNDEVIAHYGYEAGIENLEILTLTEDETGKIFVGTDGAGVYIIENGKVIKNISREDGLLSNNILRTELDPENNGVWIVTGASIDFHSQDGQTKNITNFPYGNNFDLLFYEEKMIVLSSNGLYITSSEDMLSEQPITYVHKNHLDGLYSTVVVNSFSEIVDGVLYICGNKNISSLNLDTKKENHEIPNVQIQSILSKENTFYNNENAFTLTNNADLIEIDILVPTYALQKYSVSYGILDYEEMRMESVDTFQDPTYTNLPGGEYTFLIELIDSESNQILSSKEFSIIKEYKFIENPVVRSVGVILACIALSSIVVFIFTFREQKSREEHKKMLTLFQEIVHAFSKVIDAKDEYTNGHSMRVAIYTREMAKVLNFDKFEIISAYGVALLHDVGKVAIPDDILNKPSKLTDDEFEVMKLHTTVGAEILENITILPDIITGAKYHHERYDGKGYGDGLKGEEIPLIARIICVADAFDAMYSSRVYRKKLDLDQVITELRNNSGTQFDPEIIEIFIKIIENGKIEKMLEEMRNEGLLVE